MAKYFYIFIISLFVITSCDKQWGLEPRNCFWEFGASSCGELDVEREAMLELYALATDSVDISEYGDILKGIDSCHTLEGCPDR